MTTFASTDIQELRLALGWSAREMGEFFNRTGVTIYHWESGKTSPGDNMQALLKALQQEFSWQERKCSEDELQQWTDQLLDRGIEALLHETAGPFTVEEETSSCQHMIELACKHGGLTIRSASGEALAYLVPNSTSDRLRWARTLLDITATEEHATELQMNPPDQDREVSVELK